MRVLRDQPPVRGVEIDGHLTGVRFVRGDNGLDVFLVTYECGREDLQRVATLTHNQLPEFVGALKAAMPEASK